MPKKSSKPKVGRPSEGRKPVTMRLTKYALTARNGLARAWSCDKTEAVEQALALCERLAITGNLPPLPVLPNIPQSGTHWIVFMKQNPQSDPRHE